MVELLCPMYEATRELSGEYFIPGAVVIPITKNLMVWYTKKQVQPPESTLLQNVLQLCEMFSTPGLMLLSKFEL